VGNGRPHAWEAGYDVVDRFVVKGQSGVETAGLLLVKVLVEAVL